ncbi:putative rhomboid protease [Clarireedia jacksonii]
MFAGWLSVMDVGIHPVPAYVVGGLGYLRFLAPPEKILRWIEGKMNLLGRLPHYVSVDQKTYGRYGVLPTSNNPIIPADTNIALGFAPSAQRLGP